MTRNNTTWVTFPNDTKLNLFCISEHVVHFNNLRRTILTYSNRVMTDEQMYVSLRTVTKLTLSKVNHVTNQQYVKNKRYLYN